MTRYRLHTMRKAGSLNGATQTPLKYGWVNLLREFFLKSESSFAFVSSSYERPKYRFRAQTNAWTYLVSFSHTEVGGASSSLLLEPERNGRIS